MQWPIESHTDLWNDDLLFAGVRLYMGLFFSRIFDDLVNLAPPLIADEEETAETASESSFASGIYCFHDPGLLYKDLFMWSVILQLHFF